MEQPNIDTEIQSKSLCVTKRRGLYFVKEKMTSVWIDDKLIPVTILRFPKTFKLVDGTCMTSTGYKFKQPQIGTLKKNNLSFKKGIIYSSSVEIPSIDFFKDESYIDVQSVSKGKGFQGPMKRWNFKGLRASHGVSLAHRSGGSTGNRTDPGKTIKGRKMAGHLGVETCTIQNLHVLEITEDKLVIKGSVSGPNNKLVFVSKAVKKCK